VNLDTEQHWSIIALLAIGTIAVGVVVAALTSPIVSFFCGAAFVVVAVRLLELY
jgi:hypothetical protein